MDMVICMHINSETMSYKKSLAGIFLGHSFTGRQKIPISEGIYNDIVGKEYLVSGVTGDVQEGRLVDYFFFLESLDESEDQITLSVDDFMAYFTSSGDVTEFL